MADATTLYKMVIQQTTQFVQLLDQIELLADRFATDANLATVCAAAANSGGRTDLTATDFNNWLASVAAMRDANIGNVKAFFYKML